MHTILWAWQQQKQKHNNRKTRQFIKNKRRKCLSLIKNLMHVSHWTSDMITAHTHTSIHSLMKTLITVALPHCTYSPWRKTVVVSQPLNEPNNKSTNHFIYLDEDDVGSNSLTQLQDLKGNNNNKAYNVVLEALCLDYILKKRNKNKYKINNVYTNHTTPHYCTHVFAIKVSLRDTCCAAFAVRHLLRVICCAPFAARHLLRVTCCATLATQHLLRVTCCASHN